MGVDGWLPENTVNMENALSHIITLKIDALWITSNDIPQVNSSFDKYAKVSGSEKAISGSADLTGDLNYIAAPLQTMTVAI